MRSGAGVATLPFTRKQAQRVVAQLLALGAVAGDEIDCVIVVQEEQTPQLLSLLLLLFFVLLAAEGFERVLAAARRVGLRRVHEGDHPDWNGRGGREGDASRGLQGEENGVRVVGTQLALSGFEWWYRKRRWRTRERWRWW